MIYTDRALFGDEPLTMFKTIRCDLVFNFKLIFFRGNAERAPFVCQWGSSLANVSKVIGNPVAKLLRCVRGYWPPNGKIVRECQIILALHSDKFSQHGIGP
jgi:hypothetical protein